MDPTLWAIVAGAAVVLVAIALWLAPARTNIVVDTPTSTARADMRLMWGLGPAFSARLLPKSDVGAPLAVFNDVARVGHALMTPGIADAAYEALRRLFQLKPRVARVELGVNLGDNAQNLVVQTAAQAALAAAPASVRESVSLSRCEAPGAELHARFELNASPMRLASIYREFKNARAVREFRRRLKRKPKPGKKAPREVRAS